MPDLPNRAERESELAAALLLVFESGSISASAVADAVRRPLQQTYADAGRNLIKATSADGPPAPPDSDLDKEAADWSKGYAAALGREIADSTADLAAKAADPATVYGRKRAEMIAATEITRAISAAEAWLVLFWINDGFEAPERVWHTEQDGLVCPVCRPLNGQPEAVWADRVPAGPPAHPNCRCWLDYQVS